MKEYERASQDAAWAIEKNPTWFKGYYRKAQISEKLELFPSAVEEAKMALEYCETEKDRVAMQKLVKQLKQLTKKMVQKENPCTSRDVLPCQASQNVERRRQAEHRHQLEPIRQVVRNRLLLLQQRFVGLELVAPVST